MTRITVFGASGKVGQLVVPALLAKGYDVVAFVHSQAPFAPHDHLTVVRGDIHTAADVSRAMAGSEVVISTLGSWHTPTKDIVSAATIHIIAAAQSRPIRRFISVTGAEARAAGDSLSLMHRLSHLTLKILAPKILLDSEKQLASLGNSSLHWTVIRSPIMRSRGGVNYRLSGRRPLPWHTIPRTAVAEAIVEQVEATDWQRQAPFIWSTS